MNQLWREVKHRQKVGKVAIFKLAESFRFSFLLYLFFFVGFVVLSVLL